MFSFGFYLKLFSNYNCLHIFLHISKKRKYYKKKRYLTKKKSKKNKKNQKVYHNQKKTVI